MNKLKLFLDEDMHLDLGISLRKRGFDVAHAQELDRKGKCDAEQLAYSVAQKRCLISFNIKDFVKLHNDYVLNNREHWGIILSKQLPIGETMRRVLMVLQTYSQESMKNRLVFLKKVDYFQMSKN